MSDATGHAGINGLVLEQVRFDATGLVAVVAQQHDSGEVLMLAWMNDAALDETLRTGRACYWSRSRNRIWRKGESSGQIQRVVSLRLDCDGDALLLRVDQQGAACHTGHRSCFFREAGAAGLTEISSPLFTPEQLYGKS